eukprot:6170297-Ditylum_brightwellii.AAC.1
MEKEELCLLLQDPEEYLYFAMGGGKTKGTGYFGWVAATVRDILVETKGYALGTKILMESLCTES